MSDFDKNTLVKYLALYLPQFHTIEENDRWWGKGFTEWTNVKPAEQLFDGHYQPHVPSSDIGYYDLSDVNVMVKQAEMAKKYNIYGFCYYYYWFNGKTLLETPLKNMLADKRVDMPFCLFWANHNWTRSWDAGNEEIMLEQTYDENTYARFIDDLYPYFKDERYIKIDGRPVLLIYQADHVKDPSLAVQTWRTHAKEKYGLDLYLIHCQQNNRLAPEAFGYDAVVETTPNHVSGFSLVPTEKQPKLASDTEMTFYDYLTNIFIYVLRPKEEYKLFRCVYPTWDNTARRKKKKAWMFLGFTVDKFKKFLVEMTRITTESFEPKERFLFINAWNEWAEGCHLEPCEKYGYQILEACKEVSQMSLAELKKNGFSGRLKNEMYEGIYKKYKVYLLGFIKIPFLKIKYNHKDGKIKFYFLKIPLLKFKK